MSTIVKVSKKHNLFNKVESLFYQFKDLKREVICIEEEIEFIKFDYNGFRSTEYLEKVQKSDNINSPVEIEIIQKQKKLQLLEQLKYEKEVSIKRVERAIDNFNKEENEMFNIRYIQNIKNWQVYGLKMNVGKDTYYSIRENMIKKSIPIIFPLYNFENHIR